MVEQTTSELQETWESAAPGWAKWEATFSGGLAGVTGTLIDMAGIGAGERVLDLACGAGAQFFKPPGASARTVSSWPVIFHQPCWTMSAAAPKTRTSTTSKRANARLRI